MSDKHFENLWSMLAKKFAVSTTTSKTTTRTAVLRDGIANDEVAAHLSATGWVLSTERDGRMHITCPFAGEHSSESAVSATTYFPANTGGYGTGQFKCLHAHCEGRTQSDFRNGVEFRGEDLFGILTDERAEPSENDIPAPRFGIVDMGAFASLASPSWLIKGVLPKAELAVIFGEPGSGKSFFAFDMLCSIARGIAWRGHRVSQTPGLYIAAEGAAGFRNRAKAYALAHGVDLSEVPIGVIGAAPNLMQQLDIKDLLKAISAYGTPGVIVIDTLAASMAGDENSGEDMGLVLRHCKAIHKHTGALIVLIHHAGKDTSKGARGWSGLRGAADCEISIQRTDDTRAAIVTKQKDGADTGNNTHGFKLDVIELGTDDDGEPITSCVCTSTDLAVNVGTGEHIDSTQVIVMSVLSELADFALPSDADAVIAKALLRLAAPTSKRDNREKAIKNALDALVKNKTLVLTDGAYSRPTKDEKT